MSRSVSRASRWQASPVTGDADSMTAPRSTAVGGGPFDDDLHFPARHRLPGARLANQPYLGPARDRGAVTWNSRGRVVTRSWKGWGEREIPWVSGRGGGFAQRGRGSLRRLPGRQGLRGRSSRKGPRAARPCSGPTPRRSVAGRAARPLPPGHYEVVDQELTSRTTP